MSIRRLARLLATSLALIAPAAAASAPVRVASLNLCADELVLALAHPDQIVSTTFLAHDPAETVFWRQARRYRRNDGSLLSVVPLRPDLVVTMSGGASDRLRVAERMGIRMLDLPFARNLEEMEHSVRRVAEALGRREAGHALIARLHRLRSTAPRQSVDTIWLGGAGLSVPADSLAAQWMRLAGFRQRRLAGTSISLETLLARPPRLLLRSRYRANQYSIAQRWLSHPLARRVDASLIIDTDGRPWTCLGPPMISEIERLRGEIRK